MQKSFETSFPTCKPFKNIEIPLWQEFYFGYKVIFQVLNGVSLLRIGVVGINHKLADLKLRECFAKIYQQRFSSGKSAHINHTLVLLTTCNRSEVYFTSNDLANTHSYIINILRRDLHDNEETFDQKLYSYFGHDCFSHLARVTAGLDSAIVAETEIQGQVKAAYENSLTHLDLPCELHYLFQKSLKIGKQIRTELPLGRGVPDLEHAILNASYHVFSEPEKARILFVGASDINRKILSFLKKRNFDDITICNRSQKPANVIAQKYQLGTLEWSKLYCWTDYDIIVFGTKSPEHVISKRDLCSNTIDHKLIIDLCVPRNVDPKLGRNPKIALLNIDQINRTLKTRRERLHGLLSKAESIVHDSTKKHIELFVQREKKRSRFLAAS